MNNLGRLLSPIEKIILKLMQTQKHPWVKISDIAYVLEYKSHGKIMGWDVDEAIDKLVRKGFLKRVGYTTGYRGKKLHVQLTSKGRKIKV